MTAEHDLKYFPETCNYSLWALNKKNKKQILNICVLYLVLPEGYWCFYTNAECSATVCAVWYLVYLCL